jgi:hypothetical protein
MPQQQRASRLERMHVVIGKTLNTDAIAFEQVITMLLNVFKGSLLAVVFQPIHHLVKIGDPLNVIPEGMPSKRCVKKESAYRSVSVDLIR